MSTKLPLSNKQIQEYITNFFENIKAKIRLEESNKTTKSPEIITPKSLSRVEKKKS